MENTNISIPESGNLITEKVYPISTLWIFKGPIIIVIISLIAIMFDYYFPYLLIALPIFLIINPFTKSNFHYSINPDSLWIKEGVFSKSERTLAYGNIQNVIIKRDIFDRVFGLGTLYIENAVQGIINNKNVIANSSGIGNNLGSSKNSVSFTGLKANHAEILKEIILKKMEFNKNNDNKSGL